MSENGAIGMVGFRRYKLLWEGVSSATATIECELMQPAFDPGRPIGLVFRAGGPEFRDGYAVVLDAARKRLELRKGTGRRPRRRCRRASTSGWPCGSKRGAAKSASSPAGPTGRLIRFTDPEPLAAGRVGFDASESRGWFRKLKIEAGGKTYDAAARARPPGRLPGPVSQWWDPVVTGGADAAFGGTPTGRSIRSAPRRSSFVRRRARPAWRTAACTGSGCRSSRAGTYEGRLYLRGGGDATVALQSADGTRT